MKSPRNHAKVGYSMVVVSASLVVIALLGIAIGEDVLYADNIQRESTAHFNTCKANNFQTADCEKYMDRINNEISGVYVEYQESTSFSDNVANSIVVYDPDANGIVVLSWNTVDAGPFEIQIRDSGNNNVMLLEVGTDTSAIISDPLDIGSYTAYLIGAIDNNLYAITTFDIMRSVPQTDGVFTNIASVPVVNSSVDYTDTGIEMVTLSWDTSDIGPFYTFIQSDGSQTVLPQSSINNTITVTSPLNDGDYTAFVTSVSDLDVVLAQSSFTVDPPTCTSPYNPPLLDGDFTNVNSYTPPPPGSSLEMIQDQHAEVMSQFWYDFLGGMPFSDCVVAHVAKKAELLDDSVSYDTKAETLYFKYLIKKYEAQYEKLDSVSSIDDALAEMVGGPDNLYRVDQLFEASRQAIKSGNVLDLDLYVSDPFWQTLSYLNSCTINCNGVAMDYYIDLGLEREKALLLYNIDVDFITPFKQGKVIEDIHLILCSEFGMDCIEG